MKTDAHPTNALSQVYSMTREMNNHIFKFFIDDYVWLRL